MSFITRNILYWFSCIAGKTNIVSDSRKVREAQAYINENWDAVSVLIALGYERGEKDGDNVMMKATEKASATTGIENLRDSMVISKENRIDGMKPGDFLVSLASASYAFHQKSRLKKIISGYTRKVHIYIFLAKLIDIHDQHLGFKCIDIGMTFY